MKLTTSRVSLVLSVLVVLVFAASSSCFAQINHNITSYTKNMTSHVDGLTGRAYGDGQLRPDAGVQLYRRYCVGCHGAEGNGEGENALWFDPTTGFPKPRDFTLATFECRSTPTGTLPTDEDLFDSITRGFVTTNMPSWRALTPQDRANLIAMVKSFSPRWEKEKPGTPITIPPEPPLTIESILRGRQNFDKLQCWKCHGPQGYGDGPSAATLTNDKGDPIRPYNFSTGNRFKCGVTNRDMYRIFMTGLDSTPMPSFADVVKPDEAWDLVHFLRTLQISIKTPELAMFKKWEAAHPGELKPMGQVPGT
ncbi:MAG: cytochrome c [Candidatus Acidiferrum sp.]